MAVEHDRAAVVAASGEDDAVGNFEQRFREFIGFFGSLVGLVGFGLGILPDSTVVEKFLVVVAALALSCAVTLAIKLVPKGRTAAWLAVSGAVSVACLAALSMVAQGTATVTALATARGSAPRGGAQSSGQSATTPLMTGVLPSQQTGYSIDYRNFSFTQGACKVDDRLSV